MFLLIITVFSIVVFVLSIIAIPLIIIALPHDFFLTHLQKRKKNTRGIHRLLLFPLRQIAGILLIGSGIAMLLLPGQGLLTIFVGILVLDFPGKHRLIRFILSFKQVSQSINWIRSKAHKPPMQMPV